ncbi:putative ferulic acid Esterase/Feruloyl esterase [Coniella lustricola]|uniref:Carboxylic ester hydrolase n=1 Tax=Coniella lustricola TaxID=2025994 RepID=A0A2T3A0N6_9PEZI|nr:putative ferulic acid Esterase/Feruloyl esterase [Coniella lustricola]
MRCPGTLILAAGSVGVVHAAASSNCTIEAIQGALLSNATVTNATVVLQGGSFGQGTADVAYPTNPSNLSSLCAVIVNATSSPESSFSFGLFLPDDWNSRFLAVGNGGFAGGINWLAMGDGPPYGFASMSTDTGHTGDFLDMSFALNSTERKADWGYRALHESIVMAKAIVGSYYGSAPAYSYYTGCSTGGRQAMKEVQMYPDEFDGVMAGCPSWWTTHQQTWQLEIGLINLPENTSHYIPPSLFPWISEQVIAQCDLFDGIEDGIIMDPKKCDLYYEAMLCKPNSTTTCLNPDQLQTLIDLHRPLAYGNNTWVYPNFGVGSEAQMPSSFGDVGTDAPSLYGTQYVQYMVVNDPTWDFNDFDYSIIQQADEENPGNASATQFDLSAFHARGGKLLQYHGYADGLIPTDASIYLHRQIVSTMFGQGVEDIDSWYRFFLVPGMQHCQGSVGDAPWFFGGSGQAASLIPATAAGTLDGFKDKEHDALLALMAWVEEGIAPEMLVATKFANDTIANGVMRQRPLCPFPKFAQYVGSGNVSEAESWACADRPGI